MAQRLEVGLLWYDRDPKGTLAAKVERAALRYEARFGQRPNICYVHAGDLERETEWQWIRIVRVPNVLPGHLWVGVAGAAP